MIGQRYNAYHRTIREVESWLGQVGGNKWRLGDDKPYIFMSQWVNALHPTHDWPISISLRHGGPRGAQPRVEFTFLCSWLKSTVNPYLAVRDKRSINCYCELCGHIIRAWQHAEEPLFRGRMSVFALKMLLRVNQGTVKNIPTALHNCFRLLSTSIVVCLMLPVEGNMAILDHVSVKWLEKHAEI